MLFSVLLSASPDNVYASVQKPAQVSGITIERLSRDSVKLTWTENYYVNGYQVVMRTGSSGKFKKVKTLTANTITVSNLDLGQSYYFKVRAYVKDKKKKVYGKYSATEKYVMTDWVYLTDILSPYASSNLVQYKGTESQKMAENAYYFGIYSSSSWGEKYGYYNL